MKNLTAILFILLLTACKKDFTPSDPNKVPTTFTEVFDQFWDQMNASYVYWAIDTTDWDRTYRQWSPVFAKLDLNNTDDIKRSVNYFRQIADGLIDSHYYITFTYPGMTDSSVYPALDRKRRSPGFHYPYPYLAVDSSYFDHGFISGYDYVNTASGQPLYALTGTIQQKALYFTCNHFALSRSYNSATTSGTQNVLRTFFNNLNLENPNIKSLILDLRGNLGGDIIDLNFLMGRFITKPLVIGSTRSKSNKGRLDYTPWVTAQVNPLKDIKPISLPIIVLVDNFSASMAEVTAMTSRLLPQSTIVGELTWGATGPLADYQAFADGSFDIKGFMHVMTSSGAFQYADGKTYEGKGFPPDYPVPFNASALSQGKDPQLEKAISLIK